MAETRKTAHGVMPMDDFQKQQLNYNTLQGGCQYGMWDTEHDGYDIYCPACGKKLRLCSACEKYKAALCDYNEDTGECSMTEEKK